MDIYSAYFNNYNDDDVEVSIPKEEEILSHFKFVVKRISETMSYTLQKGAISNWEECRTRIKSLLDLILDDNQYARLYKNYANGSEHLFKCLNEFPDDYILVDYTMITNPNDNTIYIDLKGLPYELLGTTLDYTETIQIK